MRPVLAAAVVALVTAAPAWAGPVAGAPNCPVFPADNPWNTRIDTAPVAANSDAIVSSIGADRGLHPDFGSGLYEGKPIGIPFTTVSRAQKKSSVRFEYADESDKGPYPIPARPPIEGGSDRHILMVDRDRCRLYELFAAEKRGSSWFAGSGAIFDLRSNKLRPRGWTSADAAGLPILPGLARYEDVRRGTIDHALRFTVQRSRRAFVFPARHFASSLTDANLPPMGLRLRLKASFRVAGFPRQVRIVLTALQRYGMIVADNGSNWFISGAPSSGWDNDQLNAIKRVRGSNFEVVDPAHPPSVDTGG